MLLFSDISFWLVFVVFLTIYAFIRSCSRLGMLVYVIACSLLFCWAANGVQVLLLLGVAVVSWLTAGVLRSTTDAPLRLRQLALTLAVIAVLLPLAYFKYSGFMLSSVNVLVGRNFVLHDLLLPIGISFFSFQAISYLVDVYRGKFMQRVSFLEYLFYLSFFPLLLAGPITRAATLIPQLQRVRPVSQRWLYIGVWLVMLGLLKKCLVADYIAQFNDWVFADPLSYSGLECVLAIIGYSVQIYCDFSGYSDMSIGIAAMMGFHLCENFAFPYRAHNLSQFWRQWHISLSSWFRDYLYIPLGGNRCSRARTYINNIITMLVAGLWHGASWMFLLWGFVHGLGLVVCKMFRPLSSRLPDNRLTRTFCVLFTFSFVSVAWVLFRCNSLQVAIALLRHAIGSFDLAYLVPFITVRPWWCLLVSLPLLSQTLSAKACMRLKLRYITSPWIIKLIIFMLVLQLIIQFRTSNVQPFIYYQF